MASKYSASTCHGMQNAYIGLCIRSKSRFQSSILAPPKAQLLPRQSPHSNVINCTTFLQPAKVALPKRLASAEWVRNVWLRLESSIACLSNWAKSLFDGLSDVQLLQYASPLGSDNTYQPMNADEWPDFSQSGFHKLASRVQSKFLQSHVDGLDTQPQVQAPPEGFPMSHKRHDSLCIKSSKASAVQFNRFWERTHQDWKETSRILCMGPQIEAFTDLK